MKEQGSSHRQRGVTMVESLVAVLVLAIGLLGIAGLHAASVSSNQSALYRTRAVFLATDLVERIRLNRTNIADYSEWVVEASSQAATTIPAHDSSEPLSEFDKEHWEALLQHRDLGLPSGAAQITIGAEAGTDTVHRVTIALTWQEGLAEQSYRLVALINSAT